MGVLGGEGCPHATFRITLVPSSGRAAAPGHARGLGFCLVFFFSELVCDLLPRRLFDGFRERCIARRVSQSQF